MNHSDKTYNAYKTIGEVAKDLNLIDKKTGLLQTYTIRYWETQFKQIKPTVRAGNRRYYSENDFKIIKLIKFLLKEKGLTIIGVKKILNESNIDTLDESLSLGIFKKNLNNTNDIKNKLKMISKKINELKKFK